MALGVASLVALSNVLRPQNYVVHHLCTETIVELLSSVNKIVQTNEPVAFSAQVSKRICEGTLREMRSVVSVDHM